MYEDGISLPLDVLQFWAKGRPRNPGDPYHPLIAHLIDVGAVAEALWDCVLPNHRRSWFAEGLALEQDQARQWFSFGSALHDLGKLAPIFQQRECFSDFTPHGVITACILDEVLPSMGLPRRVANDLSLLIGGHHGVTPSAEEIRSIPRRHLDDGARDWDISRTAIVHALIQIFGGGLAAIPAPALPLPQILWWHGTLTVADWIGSNEEFFQFIAHEGAVLADWEPGAYAATARTQARTALDALGWTARPRRAERHAFTGLFPNFSPNRLQATVEEIAGRLTEPTITIIEAPMGEGKTEAALFLANRGISDWGQTGHIILLPTQATSNQMFARDARYLKNWYTQDPMALQLAHGRSRFADAMEQLPVRDDTDVGPVALPWFAERKRGLLAPFGVGTVDQALLGVLPVTHGFVRLAALADKTVIIDEVHAYDMYMTTILERLIEWLAAIGSPVLLLSATLPASGRSALLAAYARGRDRQEPEGISADEGIPYPRVTWLDGDRVRAKHVEASNRSKKMLQIRWIQGTPETHAASLGPDLATALADGGCAAVICNTVAQAQRVYRGLRDTFTPNELRLLHARFPADERAEREARYLGMFGPDSKTRPDCFVLVATQVIEQSLDLDFDLMVTELAPVDLILQRSGRLHRNPRTVRPPSLSEPVLWVLGPQENDDIPDIPTTDRYVYDHHVLLRSWLALQHRLSIQIPEEVADLVEQTYADESDLLTDNAAPSLRRLWAETLANAQRQSEADQGIGAATRIVPPSFAHGLGRVQRPRTDDDPDDPTANRPVTRLTQSTLELICLESDEAGRPLDPRTRTPLSLSRRPDLDLTKALLGRAVRVQGSYRVKSLLQELGSAPSGWADNGHLRFSRLAVFRNGRCHAGQIHLTLDPERGLVID